ncbi:hypothetical protein DFJ73DRAFT_844640 [Zopfochytrium polystomum]|nr:hypothetical protein DFJ73DRAFT_844640 [Zopfochytrium polystomum]
MPTTTPTVFAVVDAAVPQQQLFQGSKSLGSSQAHVSPDGPTEVFPLVLSPAENDVARVTVADAVAWAAANKESLRKRLVESRAILFRGFPLDSPQHFSEFAEALGVEPLPYVGGAAPRRTVYKDVHTTNESPPDQKIPFHHEMAQVPVYPKTLLFYCDLEPASGGETPLCPSDILAQRIAEELPDYAEKLEREGVIYTRVIPEEDDPSSPIGRGWKSTFQTTDRAKAAEAAKNLNVSLEWLPSGDVKTVSPVSPAIKVYPGGTKKVWFNSVVAAYLGWKDSRNDPVKAVTYGNGDPIEPIVIETAVKIMSEISVSIPWKKGDVVWIDNEQVLHSRSSFVPPRKILAYLGKN